MLARRRRLSITELCELYGISRKIGYKIIDRYFVWAHKVSESFRAGRQVAPTARLSISNKRLWRLRHAYSCNHPKYDDY
jgi:hypothetical protein